MLGVWACASTQQTRSAEASGFLGDYSELKPGRAEQAQLLYIQPGADFSGYERVLIDPVTLWLAGDSQVAELPRDEAEQLASYFETALRRELAIGFTIVEQAQPGTLRIRAAITEARRSRVVADVASTVLPPARVLSSLKKLATGTHAFVGRAGIEVEVLDAVSSTRLIAAVDERAGSKALDGATDTWGDVQQAYDYWARLIAARLALFRDIDAAEP
jgi:hypothetical protein